MNLKNERFLIIQLRTLSSVSVKIQKVLKFSQLRCFVLVLFFPFPLVLCGGDLYGAEGGHVQTSCVFLWFKTKSLGFRFRFRWNFISPFGVCDPELPRRSAPDLWGSHDGT